MLRIVALELHWWIITLPVVNDFCIITDADSYEVLAAMGLKAKGSGATANLVTLESVDIVAVRAAAMNVQFTPPSA